MEAREALPRCSAATPLSAGLPFHSKMLVIWGGKPPPQITLHSPTSPF